MKSNIWLWPCVVILIASFGPLGCSNRISSKGISFKEEHFYTSCFQTSEMSVYAGSLSIRDAYADESAYVSEKKLLESYKDDLDRFEAHIRRCEDYVSKTGDEYWRKIVREEKPVYELYKGKYERWLSVLKPYFDDHAADLARADAMREKYRTLLLLSADDLGIKKERVYSDTNCVFWIESVALKNAELIVKIRFFKLPKSPARLNGAHVSWNGATLGSPKSRESWDFVQKMKHGEGVTKPEENLYTYIFYGDKLADTGKIKVRLDGFSGSNELIVEKTIDYKSQEIEVSENFRKIRELEQGDNSVSKGAIVLRGKRDRGHLLLPVKVAIGAEMKSITLLLDTGASMTSIPDSVYSDGVKLQGLGKKEFTTANGTVVARIDKLSVSVGSLTKTIDVAIMPGDVGLLGVNFLDGYIYTVDVENEAVYLQKKL